MLSRDTGLCSADVDVLDRRQDSQDRCHLSFAGSACSGQDWAVILIMVGLAITRRMHRQGGLWILELILLVTYQKDVCIVRSIETFVFPPQGCLWCFNYQLLAWPTATFLGKIAASYERPLVESLREVIGCSSYKSVDSMPPTTCADHGGAARQLLS